MTKGGSNLDLAFAMDCTGSMGAYIKSATENIRLIVDEIVSKERITMRLALIEYRDHPPQDETFVTRVHNFTSSVTEAKQWLEQCNAQGGGDTPEAVADALNDACNLPWQKGAARICILISDAPPHGLVPAGDSFASGCPCGYDPLTIVRKMAENHITLYAVGVEPSIVPYRDFFMTLTHLTGGQYVPMVDASRLAQMIIAGIREEISLGRLMHSARPEIKREMRSSQRDGVDEQETARRLQKLFSSKKLRVNQMSNRAGAPSRAAEECYSKCADMADMQQQYRTSQPTATVQPSELNYNLQEDAEVSYEQAKRIVQKAKNWDYAAEEPGESATRRRCKHGSKCYDHTTGHRAEFSHPAEENSTARRSDDTRRSSQSNRGEDRFSSHERTHTTRTECRHGAHCTDDTSHHQARFSHPAQQENLTSRRTQPSSDLDRFSHERKDNTRAECRYGAHCTDDTSHHQSRFSHPAQQENFNSRRTQPSSGLDRFSHERNSDSRPECRHGSKCYDHSDHHRGKFSHPSS